MSQSDQPEREEPPERPLPHHTRRRYDGQTPGRVRRTPRGTSTQPDHEGDPS